MTLLYATARRPSRVPVESTWPLLGIAAVEILLGSRWNDMRSFAREDRPTITISTKLNQIGTSFEAQTTFGNELIPYRYIHRLMD